MIPAYLADLQLPQVFAAYTAKLEQYIQVSTTDEHIVDSARHCISGFVTTSFGQEEMDADEYFTVGNPTGKSFSLLQIDNGIIKKNMGPATKKCDCAIADEASLSFIEFKAKSVSSNPLRIGNNCRRAIEQLTDTIGLFDSYHSSQGTDIRDLRTVEAFICFRQGYPRKSSSLMNYQVAFATANKGIPLSFEREKIL